MMNYLARAFQFVCPFAHPEVYHRIGTDQVGIHHSKRDGALASSGDPVSGAMGDGGEGVIIEPGA